MRSRSLSLAALAALLALASLLPASLLPAGRAEDEKKTIKLFNGKDLNGWKVFTDPKYKGKADASKLFTVKDGEIHCTGTPFGYLITENEYSDYVLELEWKWPAKAGNSGVLCHITGPDKIWPKSWEAQLWSGYAGDIWLIDFKMDVAKDRQDKKSARHYFRMKADKAVEKPLGEWNKYRITCKGDAVRLEVNGVFVNEGKGAEKTKGKILFQSEGAPIHFRNVTLTPLK